MIELKDFRLLCAIEEHRSLTRAAATLGVSQSALSRQLIGLEDDLGRPLFFRRNRALVPTEAGRALTARAGALLAEVAALEQQIRATTPAEQPRRIATECYTCYRWLPAVLHALGRQSGQWLSVDVEATRHPIEALLRGAIDLALVSAPRRDRRLVSVRAFDDELVLIVPRGHSLASRRFVEAHDLREEALFTYDAPFEETQVARRVFLPARVRPARIHRVPFTESIVQLVAAGLGVAILAEWAIAPQATGEVSRVRVTRRGMIRHWQVLHRAKADEATRTLAALVATVLHSERTRAPNPPRSQAV